MEYNKLLTTVNGSKQIFHVTEEVYHAFQTCSNDRNPLHTEESFAVSKGFRSKVMYGNILNAFVSFFVGECLPTKEVVIHSQEIQYKNPVYMNDTLIFDAKVDGIYESVNTVEFKFKFVNEEGLVVAKGKVQIGVFL